MKPVSEFLPYDKKDLYHDLCHNKSLAISFATGASRHRLSVTKPPIRRSATPFQLLRCNITYSIIAVK